MLVKTSSFFVEVDPFAQDDTGRTALFFANTPQDVEALISRGADLHHTDQFDRTCVHYLTAPAMIHSLCHHGANMNAPDFGGETPLMRASRFGTSPSTAQALIECGANVNANNSEKSTALHMAVQIDRNFCWDLVSVLIDAGANVNAQNEDGKTALHYVCGPDTIPLINIYLDHGADPNLKDNRGRTFLHHYMEDCLGADHSEARAVVELLLQRGANPNLQDEEGKTPLHLAVYGILISQYLEVVLNYNGDVFLADCEGHPVHAYLSPELSLKALSHHQRNVLREEVGVHEKSNIPSRSKL